jgi:hypothetical protein
MIRNPGVGDYRAFTLLGISTTRFAHRAGTIGMFGSGIKHGINTMLRHEHNPVICPGNLKMEFFVKPEIVDGTQFNRVCVKYSGKDIDGSSKTSTEDLGFTLEWGVHDWTKLHMGFREFISNAIDGAIMSGGTYKDVEIETVQSPRAKAGHTAIFLPFSQDIQNLWMSLKLLFLHFNHPEYLNKILLPKLNPGTKHVHIYKNGVLVKTIDAESIFDYNLGSELDLDESRNASEWDVRYACSKALADADISDLAKVMEGLNKNPELWESKLDSGYLYSSYIGDSVKEVRSKKWKQAASAVFGEEAVISTTKLAPVAQFVAQKGFKPIVMPPSFATAMEGYGVPTDKSVLSGMELEGKIEVAASADMNKAVDMVWELLGKLNLQNGKEKPVVKGFTLIMEGGCQKLGECTRDGTVWLHKDIGGMSPILMQTALEEVVHHVTGAGDMSRDIQDFLFRMVVALVWPS